MEQQSTRKAFLKLRTTLTVKATKEFPTDKYSIYLFIPPESIGHIFVRLLVRTHLFDPDIRTFDITLRTAPDLIRPGPADEVLDRDILNEPSQYQLDTFRDIQRQRHLVVHTRIPNSLSDYSHLEMACKAIWMGCSQTLGTRARLGSLYKGAIGVVDCEEDETHGEVPAVLGKYPLT